MQKPTTSEQKPLNEIKVSFRSRVRNIIGYADRLLKENNFRILKLSAIGGAIGTLVNATEVLRTLNPGLYQVVRLGTVSYQSVDQKGDIENQRLYPKLEIDLTLDEPKEKGEGFQDKLNEEERTKLLALLNQPPKRTEGEEGQRGRGDSRGGRGFRGGRGDSRGGRGGFRGDNRGGRGGFRGGRGAPRGGRGGFRGERDDNQGGYRERNQGGFGGGNRGRGGFRGGNRGGFNNDNSYGNQRRNNYEGESRGGFRGGRGAPRGERRFNRGRGGY